MSDWDEILNLAKKIKDKKLQNLVIGFLNDPRPTNREFKQLTNIKEAPAADKWHHAYPGGLLRHLLSVTRLALSMVEPMEKTYGRKADKDIIIAAGLCHDIMKICEYKKTKGGFAVVLPLPLDHLTLAVSEMYMRGFPSKVIHTVAAHHGEAGPIIPLDLEAIIIHFADMMDAYANSELKV